MVSHRDTSLVVVVVAVVVVLVLSSLRYLSLTHTHTHVHAHFTTLDVDSVCGVGVLPLGHPDAAAAAFTAVASHSSQRGS